MIITDSYLLLGNHCQTLETFPNHRKKIHEINYKARLFQPNPSDIYSNIFNDRTKYSVPCYKKKKDSRSP